MASTVMSRNEQQQFSEEQRDNFIPQDYSVQERLDEDSTFIVDTTEMDRSEIKVFEKIIPIRNKKLRMTELR